MKKIRLILIICVIAVVALLGMFVFGNAAGCTVSWSGPENMPEVGETFSVDINLSGNSGVSAIQMTLHYDKTAVECTGIENGEVLSGMLAATNTNASDGAIISAAAVDPVKTDGRIATLSFKVLQRKNPALCLQDVSLSDENAKNIDITVAQGTAPKLDPDEEPQEIVTSFLDVPESHWSYPYVTKMAARGIINGYEGGTFKPENTVSRAEFVIMLWRADGSQKASPSEEFIDVKADDWFYDAVCWAAENGYVNGVTDTEFAPEGTLTRQQAMTILFRYSGGVSGTEMMFTSIYDSSYTDSGEIADWAKSAMYWGIYNSVIEGTTDETLEPEGTATRAEIATILSRYLDKFE